VNANYADGAKRNIEAAQRAAALLGIAVQPVEVRSPADFEPAFLSIAKAMSKEWS